MIDLKKLIKNIAIPNIFGFLGSILGGVKKGFNNIIKPSFTPPSIVFPIAWTILYILMGISAYMIETSDDVRKDKALTIYYIQLILNASWTIFFFKLKWFLFSTVLVLIIFGLTIYMIIEFYKIKKAAAYLNIPYALWLIFAGILSYNVYMLNI